MINDVEHILMYLLAIFYVFGKGPFSPSAYFLSRGDEGNHIALAQFCSEPETALKNRDLQSFIKIKIKKLWRRENWIIDKNHLLH